MLDTPMILWDAAPQMLNRVLSLLLFTSLFESFNLVAGCVCMYPKVCYLQSYGREHVL